MTNRIWILVFCALLLAVVYVCFFTDWFKPSTIQISHTTRPIPFQFARRTMSMPILFNLDRDYRLTEIKVVPLAEWQTNHSVLPLWHLVLKSEPAPTRFFYYGQNIPGMKPFVPGALPKPLETNVVYRLFLSAGSIKSHHDFEIGKKPPATSTNR